MNGLLAYSGITTKVRAMEGHLISDSQFQNMAALERVSDAVDFLKQLPSYQKFWQIWKAISFTEA